MTIARLADLARRLDAIETTRRDGVPIAILSYRPLDHDPEIRLEDWRSWVADGIGRVQHGVLMILSPEMSPEEWAARYMTPH